MKEGKMLKLLDPFCIRIVRTNMEQNRAYVRDFNTTKKVKVTAVQRILMPWFQFEGY